jgi:hypothetical protein
MSQTYSKRVWADEVPAISPMKYQVIDDTNGHVADSATIVPKSGAITTPGTPVNATNLNQLEDGVEMVSKQSQRLISVVGSTLTIATGVITTTPNNGTSRYLVDTESSAAFDDLDTINGGATGDCIQLILANSGRIVRLRSGVGNIVTSNGRNIRLLDAAYTTLLYDGTNWRIFDDNNSLNDPVFLNNDGTDHALGTVVIIDRTVDYGCKKTTSAGDPKVIGIAGEIVEAGKTGRYLQNGQVTVLVQGNVARGAWVIASSTSGRAAQYGYLKPTSGGIGIAQTEYTGGGAGSVVVLLQLELSHTVNLQQLATITNYYQSTAPSTSHTTDAGTDLLVVRIGEGGQTAPSSVSFNGVGLTLLGSVAGGSNFNVSIWYLRNPAIGTYTLTVSGGSGGARLYATNYAGSQSTPMRTASTGSSTVSPISAVGDIVIDLLAYTGGTPSASSGQTVEYANLANVYGANCASKKDGDSGSTTMSYAANGGSQLTLIGAAIKGS